MPELPDVEIFKQYLESTALHQEISCIEFYTPEMLQDIAAKELPRALKGQSLNSASRHGKYLFASISNSRWLVFHFGMSGFFKYFKDMQDDTAHDRLRIDFKNGYHLAYDSKRKLGKIALAEDKIEFLNKLQVGPDVLSADFTYQKFQNILDKRRGYLKSTLMNQAVMSGIGNIYSDEILFQAGIHPQTKLDALDSNTKRNIYEQLQFVLNAAITAHAEPQKMPENFLLPHRKKGSNCPKCKRQVSTLKVAGRTSFYCPNCQPQK